MKNKTDRIYIRVSEAEKARLQAAADNAGHPLSRFVVAAALKEARRVTKAA